MDTFLLWTTLLLVSSHVSALGPAPVKEEDFETLCSLRCPFQNKTEENFDAGCGIECKIVQCSRGCRLWRKALESSCQTVCNGTQNMLPPKELHCVMGCNAAINQYFQRLKDEIGIPPAPYLVPDTLTATSLSLAWEGKRYSDINYLVQWRYEEHAGAWQYCRNQTWGPTSIILVDNLQPYTKYRFRVALLLSPHTEPIVSLPSVVISTLAAGPPSSPPIIFRVTAVDSRRVSVSWRPGPFPNGPLHSYVLQLLGEYIAFKEDIPASHKGDFHMFNNLNANRKYLVTVSMRNAVGEGPMATAEVTTPPEPQAKDVPQPILILGSRQAIFRQFADMLDEPEVVLESPSDIMGVSIHVKKSLLFFSDSNGYVTVTPLAQNGAFRQILAPEDTSFRPLDLSVDWLNQHLYILGEVKHEEGPMWQVSRCGIDGRGLTVAVAGITVRPLHIEVDPYNGYLFWIIQGQMKGGLYRLDLANISNGIKHEVTPDIILEDPNLGAFVVDHTNFCVLVPNQSKNTVYSVSLDGREVLDIRKNTQQALFRNVTSLTIANGLFYWTNGKKVFAEAYHEGQDTYFHNYINTNPAMMDRSYISIAVDIANSQPTPVPVNPPIMVQAVLGGSIAKVTWQTPHLVGGQGKGAWQNWSYELQMRHESTGTIITQKDINNTTYCTVEGLEEDTEYIIKVAAYTSSGIGPWSSEFHGKTLKSPSNGKYPTILWSAAEGLLESDVTADEVTTLVSTENMKDGSNEYHIVDIAWLRDMLYLVTNTSQLHWYNITSHEYGRYYDIDSVGSIAIDWIGNKLYWSNPKQQLIMRWSVFGTQKETLPILTLAKELSIDSEEAFIYWSTGHAIDSARLNGDEKNHFYFHEIFSGKQVMGLTLNFDDRHIFWIVRSSEGSTLYKAPMMKSGEEHFRTETQIVADLQQPNMQGPLCYFSDHLIWLQDSKNAVIGDLQGQNVAIINSIGLSGLNMVAVRDTNLQNLSTGINAIPEAVDGSTVKIVGTWSAFNLTWERVSNVNYGEVFYEITFLKSTYPPVTTKENNISYARAMDLPPYSRLDVSIKAFTYWGSSPLIRKVLHSPSSIPTPPTNVRVFTISKGPNVAATLRWGLPEKHNGLLTGFLIKCWYFAKLAEEETDVCGNVYVQPSETEYTIQNLNQNTTYYFQVKAFTEAGEGDFSREVRADSTTMSGIPELAIVTSDAVKLVDCDRKEFRTLSEDIRPIDVAWNDAEKAVYWINELKEIHRIQYNGRNKTKVHTLSRPGLSLAIDWVGRFLYWSELDDGELSSTIYCLDLNEFNIQKANASFILKRHRIIHELEVSPFTSSLFWVEVNRHGAGHILRSTTKGQFHPLFSVHMDASRRHCTCSENPRVGKTFSLDQSNPYNPRIIYSDDWQGYIYETEGTGCDCKVIHKISGKAMPSSLTADSTHLFWSNETEGRIYMTEKGEYSEIFQLGVGRIRAIGSQLQQLPLSKCLIVQRIKGNPTVTKKSPKSVILELPEPQRPIECENISLASIQYTVYYGILPHESDDTTDCGKDHLTCEKVITYSRNVEISGLRPYSSYILRLSIKNYYSDLYGVPPKLGSPFVIKTEAGAPSTPRNVTAKVINPTLIEVEWLPPVEFNDYTVTYEVKWKTEGVAVRQKEEFTVGLLDDTNTHNTMKKVQVHPLTPGTLYQVWVRASSQNNLFTDSQPIEVITFSKPNDINLRKATPYSLEVAWTPPRNATRNHYLQFYHPSYSDWRNASTIYEDLRLRTIRYTIDDLAPKTKYPFRVVIYYINSPGPYIWPEDERFKYETLGDRPSRPGTPIIQHLRGGVYQVVWEPSRDNGATIDIYLLEGKIGNKWRKREANYTSTSEIMNSDELFEWTTYYNGSDNYWIMSDLSPSLKYVFRVGARNRYGWSEYSEISKSFHYTEAALIASQQELGIVLGITLPITVLVCAVGAILFCCVFKRREKEKKELQILTVAMNNRGPDVELANLRELPRRGNFLTNANILYAAADPPTDEEIALLPHIPRDQFKLTKFLGSGAFGEVYEGIAQGIPGVEGSTTVAIKALRKGASEQEKSEFLKEAQLMSLFKHSHILQLLGVCLDNDPHYILMELMEGGDLLSYLRANRRLINTRNGLKLLDLLEICVDVATGCRYLEDMHFVHRDLACRNCLVSSLDPVTRMVKIGDFGLARDIYKNDYYRKEGEGLLPVRWMAPESLVDGVFTSQSDVWSFGVLLWEIMTLGQQPYPARTNQEVLHYVRGGGRLGQPYNCSEQMHQLMMRCWSFNPENRPTFKYCLETLSALKERTANGPITPDQSSTYLDVRPGSTWKDDESVDDDSSEPPDRDNSEPHPYLQLLQDDTSATETTDGYEVPISKTFSGPACISEVPSTTPLVEPLPPDLSTIDRLLSAAPATRLSTS